MVDALTVPASLHTPEGRFVRVNAAAERAAGVPNARLVGGHVLDLVSPDDRAHVEEQFRRAAELGEPVDFGTRFVDGGGNLRSARAQHLPLKVGDRVAGVLILAWQTIVPTAAVSLRRQGGLLTRRQLEVLELLSYGRSTQEIADELGLAPQTVRNHVKDLLAQLSAHNRVEAVANAHHAGLLALRPLDPKPS
jgi:PAS domain S-box-containing protein